MGVLQLVGAFDPVARRDITDPKALQTIIDQLRLHVNHLISQAPPDTQAHLSRTNTQIIGPWFAENLTPNKDLDLELISNTPVSFVAPRPGWITSPQFHLSAAHTGGELRFKTFITVDGAEKTIDNHKVPQGETFYSPETFTEYQFKRADHIKLGFQTTSGFTPNGSLDIIAWLELRM